MSVVDGKQSLLESKSHLIPWQGEEAAEAEGERTDGIAFMVLGLRQHYGVW